MKLSLYKLLLLESGGVSPGDRLNPGFLGEHCHFFDPDTGNRISLKHQNQ